MDSKLINELIDILEQENRIYEEILKISKNKTNIIVEGKVTELENIVKLEQALVIQMGRLENLREEVVEKLAASLRINPSDITISELAKHLEKEQSQKLKNVQDKLGGTLKELRNSNELNSKLIKNSLDYINFSINVLTDAGVLGNNYGNTGHVGEGKKRSFFDVRL